MRIACLAQELSSVVRDIRVLPAGVFRAIDGRPQGLPGWKVDAAVASRVIAASEATGGDILVDYEHQSLRTTTNGQPVPAAGWFRRLEWREGQGLYALGIQWNEKAKAMIAAREYRYISPVFAFDANTGEVQRILSVAITNNPALPSLADLNPIAANSVTSAAVSPTTDPRNQRGMDLLRRMNEANAVETARLAGLSRQKDVPQFLPTTDPRNERGMELLRRMAEL